MRKSTTDVYDKSGCAQESDCNWPAEIFLGWLGYSWLWVIKCPSCCLDCDSGTPILTSSSNDPFALANLLPMGTLPLPLVLNDYVCDHSHLEDGWHPLKTDLVLQNLMSEEDDPLLHKMAFLVKHAFISCSCRLSQNGNSLTIRVYLIPYDLLDVQGQL